MATVNNGSPGNLKTTYSASHFNAALPLIVYVLEQVLVVTIQPFHSHDKAENFRNRNQPKNKHLTYSHKS